MKALISFNCDCILGFLGRRAAPFSRDSNQETVCYYLQCKGKEKKKSRTISSAAFLVTYF